MLYICKVVDARDEAALRARRAQEPITIKDAQKRDLMVLGNLPNPHAPIMSVHRVRTSTRSLLELPAGIRHTTIISSRPFSVLNRPPPRYDGHVPLTTLERGALAAGSAIMSLVNPRRGGKHCVFLNPIYTE